MSLSAAIHKIKNSDRDTIIKLIYSILSKEKSSKRDVKFGMCDIEKYVESIVRSEKWGANMKKRDFNMFVSILKEEKLLKKLSADEGNGGALNGTCGLNPGIGEDERVLIYGLTIMAFGIMFNYVEGWGDVWNSVGGFLGDFGIDTVHDTLHTFLK